MEHYAGNRVSDFFFVFFMGTGGDTSRKKCGLVKTKVTKSTGEKNKGKMRRERRYRESDNG